MARPKAPTKTSHARAATASTPNSDQQQQQPPPARPQPATSTHVSGEARDLVNANSGGEHSRAPAERAEDAVPRPLRACCIFRGFRAVARFVRRRLVTQDGTWFSLNSPHLTASTRHSLSTLHTNAFPGRQTKVLLLGDAPDLKLVVFVWHLSCSESSEPSSLPTSCGVPFCGVFCKGIESEASLLWVRPIPRADQRVPKCAV
ncbi:hypothetical protein BDK51DRAFT_45223 [Blyttiomyces helicus]|uniref:Uncharacterized protein n=1 Tax=Blyttiomyces helicus TaxID=388810 RepID=A0A4V1IQY0_9FUNG|nr:hypothetical protein BDK51DRAFT_45223 [Blyttiomyces helicus]|eukprot:RKO88127.1 hypothetical protein BDK51DRAFT_45223 [Blyttiomyces helicus]